MTVPLSEKYRPKKFSDIIGQETAIDKIKAFITAFTRGISKKKALLLYGPAGTGKTTLAHTLAKENEFELFELNASDLRNRKKLDEVLKPSLEQSSLFSKGKIILIDEVDGVTTTDFGGLPELIVLIERTKFPIIITANDVWQQKFSLLRQKCELVQIKEIPYILVLDLLKKIIKSEEKQIEDNLLKSMAAKSKGDLRAALNDLHSIIYDEQLGLTQESIDEREKLQDIFQALQKVFKLKPSLETLEIFDTVDIDMDQIVLWLEENIPREYKGEELARAFEAMSKADIFKGRIHRQQHWHFLTYQNFFLSYAVSAAREFKNPKGFTKYERPTRVLKIWMANQKNERKKSIAAKYAEYAHISKKRALKEFILLASIIDDKTMKEIDLSEEEIEYLTERKAIIKEEFTKNIVSV